MKERINLKPRTAVARLKEQIREQERFVAAEVRMLDELKTKLELAQAQEAVVKSALTLTPVSKDRPAAERLEAAKRFLKAAGLRYFCDKRKTGWSLKLQRPQGPASRVHRYMAALADSVVQPPAPTCHRMPWDDFRFWFKG